MIKDIAVLLSGGVDSSVVVHLLCEQGYKPNLFYIKIGSDKDNNFDCSAEEDIQLSQLIARKYGLKLEVVDLHRQYWDNVVSYIVEKSASGLTPNPDVMCNRLIKFGCFEQNVGHQYEKTATGHYATIREKDGCLWLGTAKDRLKDQTDFLCQITYLQLSKLMFPIGEFKKEEVRSIAQNAGLASARRKDSQGICFLGKISYNDLLLHYLGEKEGKIVEYETGKVLGTHKGFWFHTIGQRKGLGLSGGPWFVIDKDKDENVVYISKDPTTNLQYGDEIILRDFNFITRNPGFTTKPTEITFKNRHTPDFISGTILFQEDKYIIKSSQKIQGIAPGQFGVVYDKDSEICFGSGEITLN